MLGRRRRGDVYNIHLDHSSDRHEPRRHRFDYLDDDNCRSGNVGDDERWP